MNKNYETAFKYVQDKYPWLFGDHIESITLVLPGFDNRGWYGLHRYNSQTEKSTIQIRDGHHDVISFIDTIVHELVHAAQYQVMILETLVKRDVNLIEHHADGLAYQAVKQYKLENNIPLWK